MLFLYINLLIFDKETKIKYIEIKNGRLYEND
jgi:hypothetical protein